MVQILPKVESFGSQFGKAFGTGAGKGVSAGLQAQQESKKLAQENEEIYKKTGIDLRGFSDSETRKVAFTEKLKGQREKDKFSNELMQNKTQIDAIARERGLSPESTQGFDDPKLFEQVTRPAKPAKLAEGERPIDSEQLVAIENVRSDPEYEEASPSKKYQMLTKGGVSRANATAEANISAEEFKEGKAGEREFKKERMDIHKESAKYDEELINNTKVAKKQIDTIQDISKAIKSGNVKPTSWTNIFKGFGKLGEQISKAIMTKDDATIMASIPALLEGWKDVFGVRLSDADLKVLQDKLPDIGKNAEANRAILKIMEKYADQTLLRSKIAAQIKKENKGWRPLGYADQIEERYDQMIKPVNVRNPKTGRIVPIPAYEVSAFVEDGGEIVNE